MKIYFNPNCSKCRNAVARFDENKIEYQLNEYLDNPPSVEELENIANMLQDPLPDLVRKDANFRALGLNETDYQTKDSIVRLLSEHPELIQRPIVVTNGQAKIARDPEIVDSLIG